MDETAKIKVTIYSQGIIGVRAVEARLLDHGRRKYAQYPNAPFVEFIQKRKRRGMRIAGPNLGILIVEGWNQPKPDGIYDPSSREESGGVVTMQGRYSSCDPRWQSDFDKMISEKDVQIIADYREH